MTEKVFSCSKLTLGHRLACILLFIASPSFAATEYHLAVGGDDSANGLTPETAFATVEHAVESLAPGDTLTIQPGEYFGSASRTDLGSPDAVTTIRAAIPGTAVLRGDIPIEGFAAVEGMPGVYRAAYAGPLFGVFELSTLTPLMPTTSATELQYRPGQYWHDPDNGQLYVSSSDFQPVTHHRYSVAAAPAAGLALIRPVQVVIDGLAVRGYTYNEEQAGRSNTDFQGWGIWLEAPSHCIVRDCRVFLNAAGIGINSGGGGGNNRVEDCELYANHNPFVNAGGIAIYRANDDVIRNNRVYRSPLSYGIRFYHPGEGTALLEGNSALSGGLQIKGGELRTLGTARNNIAVGQIEGFTVLNSIVGTGNRHRQDADSSGTVYLNEIEAFDPDANFADPINGDFRLQATSELIGTSENGTDPGPHPYTADVFFVSPEGSDSNPGTSLAYAWKTVDHAVQALRPGDTLYLAAGSYSLTQPIPPLAVEGRATTIRGRANDEVLIDGNLLISGSHHLEIANLQINGSVSIRDSENIALRRSIVNSPATAIVASDSNALTIAHSIIHTPESPAVTLDHCQAVSLTGNIFTTRHGPAIVTDAPAAIAYSDYNNFATNTPWTVGNRTVPIGELMPGFEGYSTLEPIALVADSAYLRAPRNASGGIGPLGLPLGPYAYSEPTVARVSGPVVHSTTPTTANIEWRATLPGEYHIQWGSCRNMKNHSVVPAEFFGSYSFTGLNPDSTYYFRIAAIHTPEGIRDYYAAESFDFDPSIHSFRTTSSYREPKTFHVSPNGNNSHSGLTPAAAWQSASHAAAQALPGDTIILHSGIYRETVRIRSTGTADRPITLRAADSAEVWFNSNGMLNNYIAATYKDSIRLQGLRFGALGMTGLTDWPLFPAAAIRLFSSSGSHVTRCLLDGRSIMYSGPFIRANRCPNLVIDNCAVIDHMGAGIQIINSPDVVIDHCVLLRPKITGLLVVNRPGQMVHMRNSIITDNLDSKAGVQVISVARHQTLVLENNVLHLRQDPADRNLFEVYGDTAYQRAANSFAVVGQPDDPDHPSVEGVIHRVNLNKWMQEWQATPDTNLYTNPQFAIFANDPDLKQAAESFVDGTRGAVTRLDFDYLMLGSQKHRPISLQDLIATDPTTRERNIGLQPE